MLDMGREAIEKKTKDKIEKVRKKKKRKRRKKESGGV
jgi:hypothetical protein